MSPDPWLMTQVRRRASQIVEDWSERVYVRCIVDELQGEGISDIRHMPADELDALIIKHTVASLLDDDVEESDQSKRNRS